MHLNGELQGLGNRSFCKLNALNTRMNLFPE